ncbi:hypothetical protein FA95DRAFT_1522488 [Auriscalpium vulgare]|uniref:Uncharacterized protein n=1 Tax=Auriscalpium vulgare TaxID=40419 RepID=A0ACB8RLV7_9AGAM|nr:hypothetical protein FA95DRAFT_1522488 [Auriscalpium vulgare]
MLSYGSVAVALVQRQVMVVQASRPHDSRDRYLDVYTYSPFGDSVFLAADAPCARIASHDLLTIFPDTDVFEMPARDTLELPPKALAEFRELAARNQKRYETLWSAWKGKFR